MILGIGTDLVYLPRVITIVQKFGVRFANRILVAEEQIEFNQKPSSLFLAKRFAAKEAAAKALGTGIAEGVSFQDFWVTHTVNGKPILNVSSNIYKKFAKNGFLHAHLAITDEKDSVLAFVVLEC